MTENLDAFLADFGVDVTIGLASGKGILDMPDDVLGDGVVISTEYVLTVKSSFAGSTNSGDSITVNSVGYTVREARKIDDGSLTRLVLSKT